MSEHAALMTALGLHFAPSRVRAVKSTGLPCGVHLLLRIAARDPLAMDEAIRHSQRDPQIIMDAAVFFIEQVLLSSTIDHYRILGADPQTPREALRANMVLLLKWLHPDTGNDTSRSYYAARVTQAWNSLKTDELRAAYDTGFLLAASQRSLPKTANITRRNGSQAMVSRNRSNVTPEDSSQPPRRHLRKKLKPGLFLLILRLFRGSRHYR